MGKGIQKYLRPSRPGLIVRDPLTRKPLDAGGELKPYNTYWHRRLIGGDVVECANHKPGRNKARAEPKMEG